MAHAHLNGSVNLADAEAVFRTVSEIAGDSVDKIPDGETGARQQWIAQFGPRLRKSDDLVEIQPEGDYVTLPHFAIVPGKSYDEIEFPNFGYADAALESWAVFTRLRDAGVIGEGVRFQVSLPTVTAGVGPFIKPEECAAAEPAFARRLRFELDQILDAVPHSDLAIQYDLAVEMGILEGIFPTYIDPAFDGIVERMAELGGWVPADVELGFHLCYGDAQETIGEGEGQHWQEPADSALMVKLINALCSALDRPIGFFTIPVPIDRDDDAFYAPLADLQAGPETTIVLGLVHHQDGIAGTQGRIEVAKRHLADFGVCTECGLGRKPAELVPALLEIQRAVVV